MGTGIELESQTPIGRMLRDGEEVGPQNPLPTGIDGISVCAAGLADDVTVITHTFADANDVVLDDIPAETRSIEIYCGTAAVLWAIGGSSVDHGRVAEPGLKAQLVLSDAALAAVETGLALHISGSVGASARIDYLKQ